MTEEGRRKRADWRGLIAVMDARRLYRSRSSRMLAGVCGGIAEYFHIDPTLVRLGWVALSLLTFHFGAGLLLYIVWWIVVPEEGR